MTQSCRRALTVRVHSGLTADSILAGLAALTQTPLEALCAQLFPHLDGTVRLAPASVRGIAGSVLLWNLPEEGHVHRTAADVAEFYDASALEGEALRRALLAWDLLVHAEAAVHGADLSKVHFHEVGRLSNLIAVGMAAALLTALSPSVFVSSPLPMGDGAVRCAHGTVPFPAPALLAMLDGAAVAPWSGRGEPVTPTGLALLRALGAEFGPWPAMTVRAHATSFAPGRVFEGAANGLLWILGDAL